MRKALASEILMSVNINESGMILIVLWEMVGANFKGSQTTEENKKENSNYSKPTPWRQPCQCFSEHPF